MKACQSCGMPLSKDPQGGEKMLKENLDRLHTTDLGAERIKRNLCLDVDDVVNWCRLKIKNPKSVITRKGKNWYVNIDGCKITVNTRSYTIITAHKTSK